MLVAPVPVPASNVTVKPFGEGGRWVGSAPTSFDNAWLASYLSKTIYKREEESNEAFPARFQDEMTTVDGATACT